MKHKWTKEQVVAIKKSIKHWERMIDYAKKKPKNRYYDPISMTIELGELPVSEDCALCRNYVIFVHGCRNCPLYIIDDCCIKSNSSYRKTYNSNKWGTWVKSAENMLKVLVGLLK